MSTISNIPSEPFTYRTMQERNSVRPASSVTPAEENRTGAHWAAATPAVPAASDANTHRLSILV